MNYKFPFTMKHIILTALLIFASTVNAQTIKVFGKVTDSLEGPVPGTTVMLIGQQDSILKSFGVTDKEGNFVIRNVKPDDYLFKANFYGYQPYEMTFSIGTGSTDTALGLITLQPKMLNAVTVSADYIPIQIKGDTIEYDSRAFETGQHDVVENLLEQLPGVEVQADGSIKVQGKTVEKILVDGEEFFGNDPTIATKNLPADAVDKVQVFDKDSDMATFTGVDDGNEETTINLKLKEDRKKGYFGNLDVAYGDQNRYKVKGNVNYFKDKWQVSGIGLSNNVNETGFSINDYISFMGGIQSLMDGSGTLNFDGDQGLPLDFGQNNNGFLNTNAIGTNLNYKPSKKATINSSIFFNTFDKTFDREIDRTTFFQDSSVFAQEGILQNNTSMNNRGNIHYKQEFDSTHFLNVDVSAQWTSSEYSNSNSLSNFNSSNVLRNEFITDLGQSQFQYRGNAKLDYRKKFKKKGQYTGLGFRYGLDNQDQAALLAYQNTAYTPDAVVTIINQNQNDIRANSNLSGNWMFSQPLSKRQLLQIELAQYYTQQRRDREVRDELAPDNEVFNPFLSGNGQYMTHTSEAGLNHKYLKKKFKTTVGAAYNFLTLQSQELFTGDRTFNYILPSFMMNWEINKSSDLRLNYRTQTNSPTLVQLQSIPNNTNPAEVVLGNTELIPEYAHNLSLEYNVFNEFNFTHFMFRVGAARIENKINYSQFIDATLNRVFLPENNGLEEQVNSYVSFGTNLNPIKTKFNITNSSNISRGRVKLNDAQNQYTSIYTTSGLTIENTKKKVINIRTGIEGSYSKSAYSENEAFNGDFFNWNYSGNVTWKIKDRWELNANAKHYFFPGFESNNEQLIINASAACNFLESRKLQVYVSAFDLLNQNTGINQTYFLNYFEQERTATLARYFLVGVKYAFNKLGAK